MNNAEDPLNVTFSVLTTFRLSGSRYVMIFVPSLIIIFLPSEVKPGPKS
jgi:hypothetical protein